MSYLDDIRKRYESEAASYNEDDYREEIRKKAENYGVKYKENYFDNQNFGTARNKRKKAIIISAVLLILLSAGVFIYYKKFRNAGKSKK